MKDFFFKETYLAIKPPTNLVSQFPAFTPKPSDKDYELGEITRYFAQQTNQANGEITEISTQTYNTLQGVSLFRTVSLRWRISGPSTDAQDFAGRIVRPGIERANKAAISSAAKVIPNIGSKLTNVFQLWRGY